MAFNRRHTNGFYDLYITFFIDKLAHQFVVIQRATFIAAYLKHHQLHLYVRGNFCGASESSTVTCVFDEAATSPLLWLAAGCSAAGLGADS